MGRRRTICSLFLRVKPIHNSLHRSELSAIFERHSIGTPDGKVRGIVVGDIIRRLVEGPWRNKCPSRLKWQLLPSSTPSPPRQDASVLFTSQCVTDVDPEVTVISIDGSGGVRSDLPETTYLWEDEMAPRSSSKGRRGARRSSHAMFFALGQHPLPAAQARLQDDERVFAYLDDIYAVCRPDRVGVTYSGQVPLRPISFST